MPVCTVHLSVLCAAFKKNSPKFCKFHFFKFNLFVLLFETLATPWPGGRMDIRVFIIRFRNLRRFGFKSATVHRPSVCPMCCIEHTLYHYYTTLGGGPICNFLRLFSSISSLPLTTLLQLILGLVDYFKNKWGQTKELAISFY